MAKTPQPDDPEYPDFAAQVELNDYLQSKHRALELVPGHPQLLADWAEYRLQVSCECEDCATTRRQIIDRIRADAALLRAAERLIDTWRDDAESWEHADHKGAQDIIVRNNTTALVRRECADSLERAVEKLEPTRLGQALADAALRKRASPHHKYVPTHLDGMSIAKPALTDLSPRCASCLAKLDAPHEGQYGPAASYYPNGADREYSVQCSCGVLNRARFFAPQDEDTSGGTARVQGHRRR